MAIVTFTLLCNHHHHPSPELFHFAKLKLNHQTIALPIVPPPAPGHHHSTFFSVNLTALGTSLKWNQRAFVHSCQAYFTQRNVCNVHPRCGVCQHFLPLQGWLIFRCMYVPYFGYPCICRWTFGLLPPFGYCESCCCEHGCANTCSSPCFHFFSCIYPEMELLNFM